MSDVLDDVQQCQPHNPQHHHQDQQNDNLEDGITIQDPNKNNKQEDPSPSSSSPPSPSPNVAVSFSSSSSDLSYDKLQTINEGTVSQEIESDDCWDVTSNPTNNRRTTTTTSPTARKSSSTSSSLTTPPPIPIKHRPSLLPDVDSKLFGTSDDGDEALVGGSSSTDGNNGVAARRRTTAAYNDEVPQIFGIPCRLFFIFIILSIAVLIGTILAVIYYESPTTDVVEDDNSNITTNTTIAIDNDG